MNYGGAGPPQFGQPGIAANGQPSNMNSGSMGPGQLGQQQMNLQQQRMMMQQQNFRPMYAQPGTLPQQPAIHTQGQMYSQPIQPGSKQMQQQYMAELMSRMPDTWKASLQNESNPERKRHLLTAYHQRLTQVNNQNRMHPNMVPTHQQPPRGAMPGALYNTVPMTSQQQPLSQPQVMPGHMQPHSNMRAIQIGGMMPSSASTSQIQSVATGTSSHSNVHMTSQGQTPQTLAPAASPQVAQPGSHNQQLMAPSPAMLNVGSTGTGSSPGQVAVHQGQQHSSQAHMHQLQSYGNQPNTPQSVPLPQPGSVPETGPQHPSSVQSGEQMAELNIAREEIRSKYLADLIRLRERFLLDGKTTPAGFDKLIEILEYKRSNVTAEQLRRAIVPSVRLLDQNSLGSSLSNELRLWSDNDVVNVEIPDPWEDVREQFIRVPDEVIRIFNPSLCLNTDRKRKHSEHTLDLKRSRIGNDFTGNSATSYSGLDIQDSLCIGMIDKDITVGKNNESYVQIQIDCEFDSKQKWMMPEKASRELSKILWRVDTESLPSSSKCPDAMICFDSRVIMCPPLRVLVPKSYPADPAVVQFERSFPADGPVSQQLSSMFERLLSVNADRSLTTIHETFHLACQELVVLKSVHNGHYIPNKHQHKQLVA